MLHHGRISLENFKLSEEGSQNRPYIAGFHLYEMSRITNSKETENRSVIASGWGERG